jgi:hypothetical protein
LFYIISPTFSTAFEIRIDGRPLPFFHSTLPVSQNTYLTLDEATPYLIANKSKHQTILPQFF